MKKWIASHIRRDYFVFGFYILIFLISIESVSQASPSRGLLGKIIFPTSARNGAQIHFEQGVLLLHNFEYQQARQSFQEAQKADPSFALAYWGEAMTHNYPVWNEQNLTAARQALLKLAATNDARIKMASTVIEKGFIESVNILFGEGSKEERDAHYSDYMDAFYRSNPGNDEIAAFYALALLGKTEGKRDTAIYMRAAAVAEEIMQRNREHPGGLHYALHSYDDEIHAPLGLRAALTYSKIAADSPHALHMPSHIFFPLKMWDHVIASNKAAWEAGVQANPNRDPLNYTIHDLHALHWLHYGYLQIKDYAAAFDLTKEMERIVSINVSPMAKFHYIMMRATYISESGQWNVGLMSIDSDEMEPTSHATNLYINAMIALARNDQSVAERQLSEIQKLISLQKDDAEEKNIDRYTRITATEILITQIIALELESQILIHNEKIEEGISILKKAATLEEQLIVEVGPPIPIKAAHELLKTASQLLRE